MNIREPADLIRDIREEVIGLLFNRHVFRTHQEIVRLNPRLQGVPCITFARWAQVVYAQAAAVGIRRLAGQDPEQGDVNLVGLLEMFIREPKGLWDCFVRYYRGDATRVRHEILRKEGTLPTGWETLACKRLLGEDRKVVISAAQKAVHFASKRVAHSVPHVTVSTTFSDLDDAIDTLRQITEKYTKLACAKSLRELAPLHRAGEPTIYSWLAHRAKDLDLLEEMKRDKLSKGWDAIFLDAWASREDIERPLGETPPPRLAASGG